MGISPVAIVLVVVVVVLCGCVYGSDIWQWIERLQKADPRTVNACDPDPGARFKGKEPADPEMIG